MKCYITTTCMGFIATNEENRIIEYKLFDGNTTEYLEDIQKDTLIDPLIDLLDILITYYDEIIIETQISKRVFDSLNYSSRIRVEDTTSIGRRIRSNLDEVLSDITSHDTIEVRRRTNKIYNDLVSNQIRESIKTNDLMIIETVNSLKQIEDTTGKLIEQLRNWTRSYLPELDRLHNNQLYASLIADYTSRELIAQSPQLKSTNITLSSDYDITMTSSDLEVIKKFAQSLSNLYKTQNLLEEFIHDKMQVVAPNVASVAGDSLGAKLIAHTNGLEELAKLPSSTVQILGAEKATFRHLKTGENPPKHGLIFQHPLLRGSNWWVRGKIARTIASKISIAARKDAYSGEFDPNLSVELEEKVDKIKKDHPFVTKKTKKNKKRKKKNHKKASKKRRKSKRNKKKLNPRDFN